MALVRFIVRRLLMLVVTLLVASFVIYGSLYLAPGSPIATLTGSRTPPPGVVAELNARYHLNDPFLVRYSLWLKGAVTGDLGESIPLRENVSTLIAQRAAVTAELVLYAGFIIIVTGIALGLIGGLRRGVTDIGVIGISTVSAALPSFVASVLLILVFAVNLGWFPALGTGSGVIGTIDHLTLPAIALAFTAVALVARVTRSAVRDEMRREHVQTAIGRGVLSVGSPPARAPKRRDTHRDGIWPHDREPDRPRGGGRNRLQPQRPGLVSGECRPEQRLCHRPRHQPGAGDGVRGHEHDRRHPVCGARPRVTLGTRGDEHDRAGTQRDAPGSARGHPHAARRPGTPRHRRPRARLCRGHRCRCADRGLRSADRPVPPQPAHISYAFVGAQGNHLLGFDGRAAISSAGFWLERARVSWGHCWYPHSPS